MYMPNDPEEEQRIKEILANAHTAEMLGNTSEVVEHIVGDFTFLRQQAGIVESPYGDLVEHQQNQYRAIGCGCFVHSAEEVAGIDYLQNKPICYACSRSCPSCFSLFARKTGVVFQNVLYCRLCAEALRRKYWLHLPIRWCKQLVLSLAGIKEEETKPIIEEEFYAKQFPSYTKVQNRDVPGAYRPGTDGRYF